MAKDTIIGSDKFKFKVIGNWEKLPAGFNWNETAGVIADNNDDIYVFNRGNHPVIIFDRLGNFKSSWGEGLFTRPHGLTLAPDNTIFCADDGDHTIRKCTIKGKVLMTLGTPGVAGVGPNHFNAPADVVVANNGDIFVADGHANET